MKATLAVCALVLVVIAVGIKTGEAQCSRINDDTVKRFACLLVESQARQFLKKPFEGVCGNKASRCLGIQSNSVRLLDFRVRSNGATCSVSGTSGNFRGQIRNGKMRIEGRLSDNQRFIADVEMYDYSLGFNLNKDAQGCLTGQQVSPIRPRVKKITPLYGIRLSRSAQYGLHRQLKQQIPLAMNNLARKTISSGLNRFTG